MPYTAPLERFLPESCVRWINGESQNRDDSNQVEEADDKLKVSELDRRRTLDAAELTGQLDKLTSVDVENLIQTNKASELRQKHYLQERVDKTDSYD